MQQTYEWVEADVVIAGHVHDGDIRVIPSYTVQDRGNLALVTQASRDVPRPEFHAPLDRGVRDVRWKEGLRHE
jgi:hypothetical protein